MPRSTIPVGGCGWHRGARPYRSRIFASCRLRPVAKSRHPLRRHFGTHLAACTLAVYASRSRSPVYFLTISQDSLPAWRSPSSPVGFSPRVTSRNFGCYMPSFPTRLVLAHATATATVG